MSVIVSRREFYAMLGASVQDAIEAELDGTTPERAPIRRALRRAEKRLMMSPDVDLSHPETVSGIADLVAIGFMTQAYADATFTVPEGEAPVLMPQPEGTRAAHWNGEQVWALQGTPDVAAQTQDIDHDVIAVYPDWLVFVERGGRAHAVPPSDLIFDAPE